MQAAPFHLVLGFEDDAAMTHFQSGVIERNTGQVGRELGIIRNGRARLREFRSEPSKKEMVAKASSSREKEN
jgi:hypothetical protein